MSIDICSTQLKLFCFCVPLFVLDTFLLAQTVTLCVVFYQLWFLLFFCVLVLFPKCIMCARAWNIHAKSNGARHVCVCLIPFAPCLVEWTTLCIGIYWPKVVSIRLSGLNRKWLNFIKYVTHSGIGVLLSQNKHSNRKASVQQFWCTHFRLSRLQFSFRLY